MSAVRVTERPTFGSVFTGVRKDNVHPNDIMCANVYPTHIVLMLNPVASMTINRDLRNDRLPIDRNSGILPAFKAACKNLATFKGVDGADVFVNMDYRDRRWALLRATTDRNCIHLAHNKKTMPLVLPAQKKSRSLRGGVQLIRRAARVGKGWYAKNAAARQYKAG